MNNFIKSALIRATRTVCQTAITILVSIESIATGLPEAEEVKV